MCPACRGDQIVFLGSSGQAGEAWPVCAIASSNLVIAPMNHSVRSRSDRSAPRPYVYSFRRSTSIGESVGGTHRGPAHLPRRSVTCTGRVETHRHIVHFQSTSGTRSAVLRTMAT